MIEYIIKKSVKVPAACIREWTVLPSANYTTEIQHNLALSVYDYKINNVVFTEISDEFTNAMAQEIIWDKLSAT